MLILKILGHMVKWYCGYFSSCFKWFRIIINSNVCNLICNVFWVVCRFFYNGVSRFLMYSSIIIRHLGVSGWWVKCHIITSQYFCVIRRESGARQWERFPENNAEAHHEPRNWPTKAFNKPKQINQKAETTTTSPTIF